MQSISRRTVLGMYAIYFHTLTDGITQRRKAFFRRDTSDRFQVHVAPATGESGPVKTKITPGKSGQPATATEKLEGVVEKAHNILIKSAAIFPFQLFPDSITLDRQKLTVVHRDFFTNKQTVCVQFSDIKNIQADIGPFFGSLTITSEHFINNTQTISNLPKQEVLKIQHLVQGFIIAHKERVDLSDIDDKRLVQLLDQLGRGEAGEPAIRPS